MSIACQLSLNYVSYTAGQTPPPQLSCLCVNETAAAIVVQGVNLAFYNTVGVQLLTLPVANLSPAIGAGQTTSIPAGSSITIGPFPIVFASGANANPYLSNPPSTQPTNSQGAMPAQYDVIIGARVTASDASINEAGRVRLNVSASSQPPPLYQGGIAQFLAPNNSNLVAAVVG